MEKSNRSQTDSTKQSERTEVIYGCHKSNEQLHFDFSRTMCTLTTFIKQRKEWEWTEENDNAFQSIKNATQEQTKIQHFRKNHTNENLG